MRTRERYVFGTSPSEFALEVARLIRPGDHVLDLGCGEGRDSVFFAQIGCVAGELHEAFRDWQTLKHDDHVINCAQGGTAMPSSSVRVTVGKAPSVTPQDRSNVSGIPFDGD